MTVKEIKKAIKQDKHTKIRVFDNWLDARNASCLYDTQWYRVGCNDGFVMIHQIAKQIRVLVVAPACV